VLYDDGDTEHEVLLSLIRPALEKPSANETATAKGDKCLGCALGSIFFDMYSGETKQFSAHKLLYSVWQNSKHLAGWAAPSFPHPPPPPPPPPPSHPLPFVHRGIKNQFGLVDS
jgi:hypothetical protein